MKKGIISTIRKVMPEDAGAKLLFIVGTALLLSALLVWSSLSVWRLAYRNNPGRLAGVSDQQRLGDPLVTRAGDPVAELAGPQVGTGDLSLGDRNAPITLVAFGDYQCQLCGEQFQDLKAVYQKHAGRVRLVWKDYPDEDKQSPSYRASLAARCAAEQNKFWEYHQFLFAAERLDESYFLELATNLNLNKDTFTSCLQSNRPAEMIDANIKEADALGISGVPFVYINRQEIMGRANVDELERYIQAEME